MRIGDVVLKPHGTGWVVGRARTREIKGRETEETLDRSFYGFAAHALGVFLGRAAGRLEDPSNREGALLQALQHQSDAHPELRLLSVLISPDVATRRARGPETLAAFSRRCGVSRHALRDIEAGRSTPRADTLLRIIVAGRERES